MPDADKTPVNLPTVTMGRGSSAQRKDIRVDDTKETIQRDDTIKQGIPPSWWQLGNSRASVISSPSDSLRPYFPH